MCSMAQQMCKMTFKEARLDNIYTFNAINLLLAQLTIVSLSLSIACY